MTTTTTVRPGALTALLGELAHAPDATGWAVPLVPGEVIGGRFEIVREIGRGGFGVVYEAKDTELGRAVAFKAIRAGSTDAVRELRTLAEAEAAARLAHPNIVHLYDVGRSERGAFLIMELLHGESLHDRLARGPPSKIRDAVRIAAEISRGLAHAHEQGVVHRDLKPGNVFLCDDGQVKVFDFGLAHVFGQGGMSGGTPEYMAPEQARGEASDERADVYALGVILHELLTGSRPAPAISPLPPRQRALSNLMSRMLAQDPADRPGNAAHVHAQLASIQKSLEPKRLLWAGVAVAGAAILGAGLFAWLWQRPLPPGRLLVAMADVANTTGDPDLEATGSFLGTALEQSRRVSLVARSRLVNILGSVGPLPARMDEAAARSAAKSAGVQVLILPAVRRVGDGYDVSVHAIGLERDEPLFGLRESAGGKAAVADAVDRLSARVLRGLREDPSDPGGPRVKVAQLAPVNTEAWRHLADWQRLGSEGRMDESRAAFERAFAADPDNPLARIVLLLDVVHGSNPDHDKAREHAEVARRNLHRVPAKERLLVEAITSVLFGGTQAERMRLLDQVIAGWPEDPLAHVWAGNIMLHEYADFAAARPYLEKAVAVAALTPHTRISFLVALGRLDEALDVARRWTETSPDPSTFARLSAVHRWRGEPAQALAAGRRSVALDTTPIGPTQRWAFVESDALEELEAVLGPPEDRSPHWLALRGRWREALAALDAQAPPPGAPAATHGWFHWQRACFLAHHGADAAAIWREVEAQFRSGTTQLACSVVWLALAGDFAAARRLADVSWLENSSCYRAFRLIEAWKRGDREAALRGFGDLVANGSAFYRGEILAELGRDREAVEAFRQYRRMPDFPWGEQTYAPFRNAAFYPRSMYLEAAALERLGEREEALKLLDRLARLWNRADPDAPYVGEARALHAQLAPGRRR